MTKEEREKAIDALKISAPIHALTEEEFNDYIQTLNKIMDWLEQEPILDKIKAEIMQLYNEVEVVDYDHNDISRIKKAHWIIREEVLWILDKYSSYPKRGADMREGEE